MWTINDALRIRNDRCMVYFIRNLLFGLSFFRRAHDLWADSCSKIKISIFFFCSRVDFVFAISWCAADGSVPNKKKQKIKSNRIELYEENDSTAR